jgi:hypothetical protein
MRPMLYFLATTGSVLMSLSVVQSHVLECPNGGGYLFTLASTIDFQSSLWRASYSFEKPRLTQTH